MQNVGSRQDGNIQYPNEGSPSTSEPSTKTTASGRSIETVKSGVNANTAESLSESKNITQVVDIALHSLPPQDHIDQIKGFNNHTAIKMNANEISPEQADKILNRLLERLEKNEISFKDVGVIKNETPTKLVIKQPQNQEELIKFIQSVKPQDLPNSLVFRDETYGYLIPPQHRNKEVVEENEQGETVPVKHAIIPEEFSERLHGHISQFAQQYTAQMDPIEKKENESAEETKTTKRTQRQQTSGVKEHQMEGVSAKPHTALDKVSMNPAMHKKCAVNVLVAIFTLERREEAKQKAVEKRKRDIENKELNREIIRDQVKTESIKSGQIKHRIDVRNAIRQDLKTQEGPGAPPPAAPPV